MPPFPPLKRRAILDRHFVTEITDAFTTFLLIKSKKALCQRTAKAEIMP